MVPWPVYRCTVCKWPLMFWVQILITWCKSQWWMSVSVLYVRDDDAVYEMLPFQCHHGHHSLTINHYTSLIHSCEWPLTCSECKKDPHSFNKTQSFEVCTKPSMYDETQCEVLRMWNPHTQQSIGLSFCVWCDFSVSILTSTPCSPLYTTDCSRPSNACYHVKHYRKLTQER